MSGRATPMRASWLGEGSTRSTRGESGGKLEIAAERRTAARPDDDVIDVIVARIVDERGRRIARLEHVIGDPLGRERQRARPMLELDQPLQMRIAAELVDHRIEPDERGLEHVD